MVPLRGATFQALERKAKEHGTTVGYLVSFISDLYCRTEPENKEVPKREQAASTISAPRPSSTRLGSAEQEKNQRCADLLVSGRTPAEAAREVGIPYHRAHYQYHRLVREGIL